MPFNDTVIVSKGTCCICGAHYIVASIKDNDSDTLKSTVHDLVTFAQKERKALHDKSLGTVLRALEDLQRFYCCSLCVPAYAPEWIRGSYLAKCVLPCTKCLSKAFAFTGGGSTMISLSQNGRLVETTASIIWHSLRKTNSSRLCGQCLVAIICDLSWHLAA